MKALRSLILIATLALLAGTVRASDLTWAATRTPHFIIYYSAGHPSIAVSAGRIAEKSNAVLERKLKFKPAGITPIYLYPDRTSFSNDTGIKADEATVGTAHTRTLVIRVDASGAYTDIAHVIPHELAHVLIFRRLHAHAINMPLWVHEGLAKYLSGDWSGADAELLQDAAASGEIMPFERIANLFPTSERERSVAYVQSYSAVRYMSEHYGRGSIPDLLSEIASGTRWNEAVLYSIGVTPERFESDWRQFLWDRYQLNRWIKLATGIVSAFMAIVAVFAFRARRIQKQRKAAQFADEETADDEYPPLEY